MSVVTLDDQITLSLSVTDRHKSAAWYSDMLGFELRYHIDEAGWTEMNTNTKGVVLGLGEQGAPTPGNCVPVFGVADIQSARAALEAANVSFDGETITMEGMVSLATLYDPDGNALMIAQDLSEGAS